MMKLTLSLVFFAITTFSLVKLKINNICNCFILYVIGTYHIKLPESQSWETTLSYTLNGRRASQFFICFSYHQMAEIIFNTNNFIFNVTNVLYATNTKFQKYL